VFGTGSLAVAPTSSVQPIPGLTQTVMVPAGSLVYVSSNGGLINTSTAASAASETDISLSIDGVFPPNGFYNRILCTNSAGAVLGDCEWTLSGFITLTAGPHTIVVHAGGVNTPGGSNATVSGNTGNVNQGDLSVAFLKS
jgi:hypothetical protein